VTEIPSLRVLRRDEREDSGAGLLPPHEPGAPYFATCDGRVLVIFETFKVGVPLPQRKMRDYEVPWPLDQRFAKALLEEVGKFRTG